MRKLQHEHPKNLINHIEALSTQICGNEEPYGKCDIWASKLVRELRNLNFIAQVFASTSYEFPSARGGTTYGHSITVVCTQDKSSWVATDLSYKQVNGLHNKVLAESGNLEELCQNISKKLPGFIRYNPSLETYFQ